MHHQGIPFAKGPVVLKAFPCRNVTCAVERRRPQLSQWWWFYSKSPFHRIMIIKPYENNDIFSLYTIYSIQSKHRIMISFFPYARDPVCGIRNRSDTVDIFDCISDLFIGHFNNSEPQYMHSHFYQIATWWRYCINIIMHVEHLKFIVYNIYEPLPISTHMCTVYM